jgi:hypothetical protein
MKGLTLSPEPMTEPLPVIPLEYAKPPEGEARARVWRRMNRISLVAGGAVALVGWVAMMSDVHAALVAGPVLGCAGALMIIGGLWRRQPWIWGIGLGHCGVCLLFVALVNLLRWGPQEATEPFRAMAGGYNLLSIPATLWAWVRRAG